MCDGLTGCTAINVHATLPQCILLKDGSNSTIYEDSENWVKFDKKAGTACSQGSDFQTLVGSFTVTHRVDVGVNYIVTPGEQAGIELTAPGGSLTYNASKRLQSKDRISIIDYYGSCGLSAPSASVDVSDWANFAPRSYF